MLIPARRSSAAHSPKATRRTAGISANTCPDRDTSGKVNPPARTARFVDRRSNPRRASRDHVNPIAAAVMIVSIRTTAGRPAMANHASESIGKPMPCTGCHVPRISTTCGSLIGCG